MRFSASQRYTLYQKIFSEEFDIDVLFKSKVFSKHFMLHTISKTAIGASWRAHRWALVRRMLWGDSWVEHMEPISLIAEYYGEKQALFFAFLIHHIGQLVVPSAFGMVLNAYHVYLAYQKTKEDGSDWFLPNYYASVDSYWNYLYVVVLGLWSTIYIESWKRKQNTLKHMWASEQRLADIGAADAKPQKGSTWYIDRISGKAVKRVLEPTPVRNAVRTLVLLLLASALAFFIWLCTMPLLGLLVKKLVSDDKWAVFRTQFTIVVYSYAVVRFNKIFGGFSADIVERENLPFLSEHEESLVVKTYVLGFVNSYLGMLAACFFFRSLAGVCTLLSIVLAMKQFVMNAIKIWEPKKKGAIEDKFKAHR